MLVIKWGFVFLLNNNRLKKQTANAHLNRSLGPYPEDMLRSFDRGIRFCAVYNKRETKYNFCTIFKFYAHAQQLKNEED